MLDAYLKKWGWTANLVLLLAAAWLLAKTVNTAVGAVIRPTPRVENTTGAPVPTAPATAPLEVDRLYPLIGQKPPAVVTAAEAEAAAPPPPKTCSDLRAPPVATSLRAQLVGGIVADDARWSTAVIVDTSSRETRTYGIGEPVQGANLLSVERIKDDRDATGRGVRVVAIVCNQGRKEYVDYETGGGGGPNVGVAPAPPPPFAGAAAAAHPPGADGVKKTADNKYEVPKSVIDGALSNLNAIATQARIVPSFKNGVANGFKVFSIQPSSFYSSIGVENGDVIQKINGYEINSPDKALEIYQKLRESRHITVDLERNGTTIRKEYNVTGP